MIDALDPGTLIRCVLPQHAFGLIHAGIEVERRAERVAGAQGPALKRHLRERGRQALAGEPERRPVEVFLARQFEAERLDARDLRRALEHDGVVIAFLESAQIERILVLSSVTR